MKTKTLLILLALLGWLALMLGAAVTPYAMSSNSMAPTIQTGDRVIVVKHLLLGTIERGDLVSLVYPPDPRQIFVKRIVGVPGDRIRLVDKRLYLNGKPLDEPYVQHATDYIDAYRDNFPSAAPPAPLLDGARNMLSNDLRGGDVVVPAGHYFVLGDNRDESLDSRYWGFVPAGNIVGRPVFIYSGHAGPLRRVALQ